MTSAIAVSKIYLAPTYGHKVTHPGDDFDTFPVYDLDGKLFVEISANTHGTRELTALEDVYTGSDGTSHSKRCPVHVKNNVLPYLYTSQIFALPEIEIHVCGGPAKYFIASADNYEDAFDLVKQYEDEDKANGVFTENFYHIVVR